MKRSFAFALMVLGTAACSDDGTESPASSDLTSGFSIQEVGKILDLVNDPAVDLAVLDGDADLETRAAKNIVAHRNGADGIYPSADDDAFDTFSELDAVTQVGPATLRRLLEFAPTLSSPHYAKVEGVAFLGWQVEAILAGLAAAQAAELAAELPVSNAIAASLVAGAPYTAMKDVGAVASVNAAVLKKLRDRALAWRHGDGTGTTCDAKFVQADVAPVAAYSQALDAFDPGETWAGFTLASWNGETCVDPADPATRDALFELVVGFADWQNMVAADPSAFHQGDTVQGPQEFLSLLDESILRAADLRDEFIGRDPTAADIYEALHTQYTQISAIAASGSPFSMTIHLANEECSEDAAIVIDLESGTVIAVHLGPRC